MGYKKTRMAWNEDRMEAVYQRKAGGSVGDYNKRFVHMNEIL